MAEVEAATHMLVALASDHITPSSPKHPRTSGNMSTTTHPTTTPPHLPAAHTSDRAQTLHQLPDGLSLCPTCWPTHSLHSPTRTGHPANRPTCPSMPLSSRHCTVNTSHPPPPPPLPPPPHYKCWNCPPISRTTSGATCPFHPTHPPPTNTSSPSSHSSTRSSAPLSSTHSLHSRPVRTGRGSSV